MTVIRLRTGHNRLSYHLYSKLRIGHTEQCPCGTGSQTKEHLLQSCPIYEPLRKGIWPDHTPVARKLYGSLRDLQCTRTATFIEETGNGEAERAVQTVKNLLRKSTDPYIALLNYCTTPLQNGYSPAELMMSRKLRNCLPAMLNQHIPFKPEVEKFKVKDEHFRNQQKYYPDLCRGAKETPQLSKGQPVWVKTPTTKEAVVVKNATPRSVVVQTEQGFQRRNRTQLRRRSWN